MAPELKIGIGADNSELNRSLQDAEKRISSFVDKVGQIGALGEKIAGIGTKLTVGITLPLIAAGKAAYDLAADFEDAMGATSQIFKNASDDVKNWADKLPSYYGIAEKEALDYSNMMGSMLKNIGGLTDKEASKQSAKLIELAGDLTAMYGGTTADAVRALTGALKGNNTMLDNYGMAASDALVKAKALEMGLISQGQEMSLAAKQAATLALIYEQSGAAQGQASREANGASGSMRALRTEIKNLGTELGSFLLPMIAPLTAGIKSMIEGFRELDPSIQKVIVVVAAVAAAAGPLLLAVGGFMSMMPTLLSGLGAIKVAFAALTGPIGLVTIGIVGIVTAVVANWGKIKPYIESTVNGLIDLYNESKVVRLAVQSIGFAFNTAFSVVGKILSGVWQSFKTFGKGILELFAGIGTAIKGALTGEFDQVKAGFTRGFAAINSTVIGFGNNFKGTLSEIGNAFTENEKKWSNMGKKAHIKLNSTVDATDVENKTDEAITNAVKKGAKKAKEKKIQIELPEIEAIGAIKSRGFLNGLGEEFDTLIQYASRSQEISNMINSSFASIPTAISEQSLLLAEEAANFGQAMDQILQEGLGNLFTGIGEAMFNGTSLIAAAGSAILGTLGQFAIMLGKELMKTAVIAEVFGGLLVAIRNAISNPYVLIAIAGAALVVGAALTAAAKRTASVAGGGGGSASGSAGGGSQSYSSSYSSGGGYGNGGEVVFRISGNDLVGVLSRQQDKNSRLGG